MDVASTRLRQTFKYPTDDDVHGQRDEMDEEEQENLIAKLTSTSETSNANYVLIFSVLPLLLVPLFIYHFFNTNAVARVRLLCLLSLTSLFSSAFVTFFMSSIDTSSARARLNSRQRQVGRTTFAAPPHAGPLFDLLTKVYDKLDDLRLDLDVEGPLLKMLPMMNGVICGLLAVAAWIMQRREARGEPELMWMYVLLPGAMALVTTVARKGIMDEERELRDLRGLRYGYKGA